MANATKSIKSTSMAAAHAAPRCAHVRLNGQPCGSPALQGESLCHFHFHYRDQVDRPGGPQFPPLEDGLAIQCAINRVLEGLDTGLMNIKVANSMLYALQTAASNLHNLRRDFDGQAVSPRRRSTQRKPVASADAAALPEVSGTNGNGHPLVAKA